MSASRIAACGLAAAAIAAADGCGTTTHSAPLVTEHSPRVSATGHAGHTTRPAPSPRTTPAGSPAPSSTGRPASGPPVSGPGAPGDLPRQPTAPLPHRGQVTALARALDLPRPSGQVYGPPWRIGGTPGGASLTLRADGTWTYLRSSCPPRPRPLASGRPLTHSRIMCPMHIVSGPWPTKAQARRAAEPVLAAAGATGPITIGYVGPGQDAGWRVASGGTAVTVGTGIHILRASGDLWR